jgi:hypothetical protein
MMLPPGWSLLGRKYFSRKGAKTQSAAAFLLCAFAHLREKNYLWITPTLTGRFLYLLQMADTFECL